jgi:phage replication initiation protein
MEIRKEFKMVETNKILTACVDWLAFTFKGEGVENALTLIYTLLGWTCDVLDDMKFGRNGYLSGKTYMGVEIYYDTPAGASDMGVMFNISGDACRRVEQAKCKDGDVEEFWSNFFKKIFEENGYITRFDGALDDMNDVPLLNIDLMRDLRNLGRIKTMYSHSPSNDDVDPRTGEKKGNTLYLGDRKSPIFIRFYDKQLQMKSVKKIETGKWNRYEVEMHKDKATQAGLKFANHELSLGQLIISILADKLTFLDEVNEVAKFWADFTASATKVKLAKNAKSTGFADKVDWALNTFSPLLKMADELDMLDYVLEMLTYKAKLLDLSKDKKKIVNEFEENKYEECLKLDIKYNELKDEYLDECARIEKIKSTINIRTGVGN